MYARAQRAHCLFAQAPDGEHTAAQRDLARHGDIAVYRLPRQRGEHRCRDGDTGAGSVLGDGPLREVDMDVLRLVKVRRDAELLRRWRRHESAARQLSCITSPKLPVSSTLPLPSITPTSTGRISPPTSVHARPFTTPTRSFSGIFSCAARGAPRKSLMFFSVTVTRFTSLVASCIAALRQILPS